MSGARFPAFGIPGRYAGLACAVAAAIALSACGPGRVARNFGEAKQALQERQIQNPEAAEVRNPVIGLGGTTAADVIANYHRNQQTEAQQQRQDRQRDNVLGDID